MVHKITPLSTGASPDIQRPAKTSLSKIQSSSASPSAQISASSIAAPMSAATSSDHLSSITIHPPRLSKFYEEGRLKKNSDIQNLAKKLQSREHLQGIQRIENYAVGNDYLMLQLFSPEEQALENLIVYTSAPRPSTFTKAPITKAQAQTMIQETKQRLAENLAALEHLKGKTQDKTTLTHIENAIKYQQETAVNLRHIGEKLSEHYLKIYISTEGSQAAAQWIRNTMNTLETANQALPIEAPEASSSNVDSATSAATTIGLVRKGGMRKPKMQEASSMENTTNPQTTTTNFEDDEGTPV